MMQMQLDQNEIHDHMLALFQQHHNMQLADGLNHPYQNLEKIVLLLLQQMLQNHLKNHLEHDLRFHGFLVV